MIKPCFETELGKLYCGDCLSVMKDIPDGSVDLVVTSPPYNKNGFRGRKDFSKGKGRWQNADISYDTTDDNMTEEKYRNWQVALLNQCYKVIKTTGSIFYNHKIRRANNKASHPFEWVIRSKAIFYQQIIWNRKSTCDHNINYCDPITELIFWLIKNIPKVYKDKSMYNEEVWEISPLSDEKHPAPFPIKLIENCILLTTLKNDTILDPFLGSGTTAVACEKLGRRWIGIEISEKYCEIAKQRIKAEYNQRKLFL